MILHIPLAKGQNNKRKGKEPKLGFSVRTFYCLDRSDSISFLKLKFPNYEINNTQLHD